ncbi:MAG TPA: YceI family protein [Acidimicrobiales bacterium]|nr:YceI family protein [Acidimicrobiales bacterium]
MSSSSATETNTTPLAPGRWTLDRAHSAVVFSVRHLGLSKVRGRFDTFDATLDVGEAGADVRVEATVEMGSVNTSDPGRDAHLRTTDFFDVEKHPTMHFVSTGLTDGGDGVSWELAGDLTINGITKPTVLDVEFHGTEKHREDLHAGFSATGEIRRSEFGIDFGILPLGGDKLALADKIPFELDLQFVEPAPAG